MSMQVADLFADLSMRTTKFSQAAKGVTAEAQNIGKSMEDAFGKRPQRAIEETDKAAQRLTWNARGYLKDTARVVTGILISQAFYQLLGVIREITSAVYQFSQQMQVATVSFTLLLGSAKEAKVFMLALEDFASRTPFMMDAATRAAQNLMAMGFAAENVIPILRNLLDAAALRGADPERVDRLVRSLGQMKAKGTLKMEEITQMAEAGIPALQILSEELGITMEQAADIGRLRISADVGIPALLRGMQKRFGGASENISKTVTGMISTIKDNLLLIGRDLTAGLFESLAASLETIVGRLIELRATIIESGLGGLFVKVFPRELHVTLKVIAAALGSIGQSLKRLYNSLKPVASAILEMAVRSLAVALPMLAAILELFSRLIGWASQSEVAIRALTAAIGTFVVAGLATTLIKGLVGAIKLLTIAGSAAVAIKALASATTALTAAMIKNPILAAIMLMTAALIGLAMSSKNVSQWLDRVIRQLGMMFGFDIDRILSPSDPEDVSEAMKKYYKDLADVTDGLDGIGDAADGAGKKLKDTFLASFDEVYAIPDQLGGVEDSLEDMIPQMPDFHMPGKDGPPYFDMPGLIFDKPPDNSLIARAKRWLQELMDELKNIREPFVFNIEWPKIPPGGTAFAEVLETAMVRVRTAVEATQTVLDNFGRRTQETLESLMRPWIQLKENIQLQLQQVGQSLTNAQLTVQSWADSTKQSISAWGVATLATITGWGIATIGRFRTTYEDLRQSTRNMLTNLSNFWEEHKVTILTIVGALVVGIIIWFIGLPASVGAALAGLVAIVLSVFVDTKAAVAGELDNTKVMIDGKWQSIKTAIVSKVREIITDLATRFRQIPQDFKDAIDAMPGFFSTVGEKLKTTAGRIAKTIGDLFGNIKKSIEGAIDRLKDFKDQNAPPGMSAEQKQRIIDNSFKTGSSYLGGFKKGGIINKEGFINVAEGNKPEAVVPLSGEVMRPFAEAIANEIAGAFPQQSSNNNGPPMYVGMLVADERSLKELERKLRIIRVGEQVREGGV